MGEGRAYSAHLDSGVWNARGEKVWARFWSSRNLEAVVDGFDVFDRVWI